MIARDRPEVVILATGSAIPYLARRENGYRFLGVAPYLGRLDEVGFDDFGEHAARVRVLVLERWRIDLLPPGTARTLEDGSAGFVAVPSLDHPEFEVWTRPELIR